MEVIRVNFDNPPVYGNKALYKFLTKAIRELLDEYAFRQNEYKGVRFLMYDDKGLEMLLSFIKERYQIEAKTWRWDWMVSQTNGGEEHCEVIGSGLEFPASPALTKLLLEFDHGADPDEDE